MSMRRLTWIVDHISPAHIICFGYLLVIWLHLEAVLVQSKFHHSRLGTKDYKKEMDVIKTGKADYMASQSRPSFHSRGNLLCAVFMDSGNTRSVINIQANVLETAGHCQWAIIIYKGKEAVCSKGSLKSHLVHCKLASHRKAHEASYLKAPKTNIPKTLMYPDLLPYLPYYQRVMLFDEDVSLVDFSMDLYMDYWDCSFPNQPPPLVVQPLISDYTEFFEYLNKKAWDRLRKQGVVASATGFVEQQVPTFDSIFFEWFLKRVLSLTRQYAVELTVDWGSDRSWCNAAKLYSKHVLDWKNNSAVVCAILVGGPSVHHLNMQSMPVKRNNKYFFRRQGNKSVQKYIDLFPTWVETETYNRTNPLHERFGSNFPKSKYLDKSCVQRSREKRLFISSAALMGRNTTVAAITTLAVNETSILEIPALANITV